MGYRKTKYKKLWVTKASGGHERFSSKKLQRSLERSGASRLQALTIVEALRQKAKPGVATSELYDRAFEILRREDRGLAARYNLKHAIMRLGPTGFPFEQLVAGIFQALGYLTKTNLIYQGRCVSHEVDVEALVGSRLSLMECKFTNSPGERIGVKVPLYVKARSQDIAEGPKKPTHTYYVVTNAKFSTDAEAYGRCAGLGLIGWDTPYMGGIKDLLDSTGLYPITCLPSVNKRSLQVLLQGGVVLTRQLSEDRALFEKLPLSQIEKDRLLKESRLLESSRMRSADRGGFDQTYRLHRKDRDF
jgi:hypothetical protein